MILILIAIFSIYYVIHWRLRMEERMDTQITQILIFFSEAHRALELLEDYHAKLTRPQDKQLRLAIERVIRIFKSRLFQALLGECFVKNILSNNLKKRFPLVRLPSRWNQFSYIPTIFYKIRKIPAIHGRFKEILHLIPFSMLGLNLILFIGTGTLPLERFSRHCYSE